MNRKGLLSLKILIYLTLYNAYAGSKLLSHRGRRMLEGNSGLGAAVTRQGKDRSCSVLFTVKETELLNLSFFTLLKICVQKRVLFAFFGFPIKMCVPLFIQAMT